MTDSGSKKGAGKTKSQETKERILDAAGMVFSEYPFHAASVRMIAKAGGFEHPLIQYHFKTKANLFRKYTERLNDQLLAAVLPMLDGLEKLGPGKGLALLIDRFLEYGFSNPQSMTVMMLNIGELDTLGPTLPGLANMRNASDVVAGIFQDAYKPKASKKEVVMWLFAFSVISGNFLGASRFHALLQGLDPESNEYRKWIKDALMYVFAPALENIIFGSDFSQQGGGEAPEEPKWKNHSMWSRTAPETKGEMTRRKILDAALHVFTHHPYNSASIRQIGKQGGFDFTLIHHYYPKKEELFLAVAFDLFEKSLLADDAIIEGLADMPLYQGMSVFLDRALSNSFSHPEPEMILMQNMAQLGRFGEIPGFDLIRDYHGEIMQLLKKKIFPKALDRDLSMWQHCLLTMMYTCVGTPSYPAKILGMDPTEEKYRKWIKQAMLYLFFPTFRSLMEPGAGDRE